MGKKEAGLTGPGEAADRVRQMERAFDALCRAVETDPAAIRGDAALNAQLESLRFYYEGGQWLADYALDERGLLPRDLKRGVLSQDGIYDLLAKIAEV